ncbi:MAG: 4-hydroxy-tetrahydrodipicolinate synthase [bacterium]|nr:4-hydroxy-tetrahydrodipicolinate synthase [bacterium]
MIKGCCTALITPFNPDFSLNKETLKKQIKRQAESRVSGILACGTTGEAPALNDFEWAEVVKTAVSFKSKDMYVMAGTGTNNTEKTIERTKSAASLGVDAALVITPYYNKPNQSGLLLHFKKVAKECGTDIIIYNVPSRTGVNILPDTVAELSHERHIIGIKEASGSLTQATEIMMKAKKGFILMSGEDALTLPLMSIGACGVISTISNAVPREMQALFELFYAGELSEAIKMHNHLYPVAKSLFIETNPVPVKYAMKYLNLDGGTLRLPLGELSEKNKAEVKRSLDNFKTE